MLQSNVADNLRGGDLGKALDTSGPTQKWVFIINCIESKFIKLLNYNSYL